MAISFYFGISLTIHHHPCTTVTTTKNRQQQPAMKPPIISPSSFGNPRKLLLLSLPSFVLAFFLLVDVALARSDDSLIDEAEMTCSSDGFASSPHFQSVDLPTKEPYSDMKDKQEVDDDFEKATKFHGFLAHMFEKVDNHAASLNGQPNLQEQEHFILSSWLKYFDMEPNLFSEHPLCRNWMYELYQRTKTIIPEQFFKIYDERSRPTYDEINVLLSIDDSALSYAMDQEDGSVNEDQILSHLFTSFRHRGFQVSLADVFSRVLLGPLKTVGYAIPSEDNLEAISKYGPLVEVGAGTGYWSAALQLKGVDVLAFDADPPSEEKPGLYFDRTYTLVKEGSCQSIFDKANRDHYADSTMNRSLLMIWPNNPDNVDNAEEFHSDRLPPVWDVDCARAYTSQAGEGAIIILVAERESNIHVLPSHPQNPTQPDSGLCASRALQQFLLDEYELIYQMDIPTWFYSDDLTIWRRRKKSH